MEVSLKINVKPFKVPNFVMADKESSDPSNDTKFAIADLDVETLDMLCDQFIYDIYAKAGKTGYTALDRLRRMRDAEQDQELRSALNDVCDRYDVYKSKRDQRNEN